MVMTPAIYLGGGHQIKSSIEKQPRRHTNQKLTQGIHPNQGSGPGKHRNSARDRLEMKYTSVCFLTEKRVVLRCTTDQALSLSIPTLPNSV